MEKEERGEASGVTTCSFGFHHSFVLTGERNLIDPQKYAVVDIKESTCLAHNFYFFRTISEVISPLPLRYHCTTCCPTITVLFLGFKSEKKAPLTSIGQICEAKCAQASLDFDFEVSQYFSKTSKQLL